VNVLAQKLHLEIISPRRVFLDEEVDTAVVRTVSGDVGLMTDHIPMVAPLAIGRIKIIRDGKVREASCSEGVVNIRGSHAIVITEAIEWIEEIDIERARKARERAEQRLQTKADDVDIDRAKAALMKALNRIEQYEQNKK
jgi:F-type H+-transporting ATPase subunit epsilon